MKGEDDGIQAMYWLYRTHVYTWRNQYVQAQLITPPTHPWGEEDCGYGFRSPRQNEPYGVELLLTYQVDPRHPRPDNYYESAGFSLYSEQLVDLMRSFGVRAEVFPVIMVDEEANTLPDLRYFIFHSLEGVLDAMDEEQSGWTGNRQMGIPRLVLDDAKFKHRPLFKCNHIYVQLMRDDLKQAIQRQGITGFDFLAPERYRSGSYRFPPDFDD